MSKACSRSTYSKTVVFLLVFEINHNQPIHICAEAGINHNGSLDAALAIIKAAKEAGADSVKFQKRAPHISVPAEQADKPKDTPWGVVPYLKYKERMEFTIADYGIIDAYCKTLDIPWFVSVWDTESYVAMKENFPSMPAWKIPSAKITNLEMLANIKGSLKRQRKKTPIILSTGMSTQKQVADAIALLKDENLVVCHCNSTYPCSTEDLNLRVISEMMTKMPCPIGYSGHEVGLAPSIAAAALGACFIERHITLDRTMWGTDQAASVEPQGFARLVKDIRIVEQALGDGIKRVTRTEIPVMQKLRGEHA